ncbi:response regulator [Kocuria sediminis]|uniref:Response regulator n=1 Tax=Kocuria sediminis TaxID=1038857 RepID=A0A6N8GNG3_9MICC|nr:response regulator [Kocuria sediminis]MUN64621.1 response regulator [Kocuria sediminis]
MTTVLVVEDERPLLRALQLALEAHGYTVVTAPTGSSGLASLAESPVDAVVLDLGLPDMDGQLFIRRVRAAAGTPILVLSARHASGQKVAALDAGADDYVTKPFGLEELLARLRAVIRRGRPAPGTERVDTDSFTLDFSARRAVRDGREVRLTPTEWKILEELVRAPGRLVPHRQVLEHVWGPAYVKETQYLRVYLAQLRRKLEADPARPRHLITEPGLGYRFDP